MQTDGVAYVLEALICDGGADRADFAVTVELAAGLRLIPLTASNRDSMVGDDAAVRDSRLMGFEQLDSTTVTTAERISESGRVAYVHAEFHGGVGFQAAVAWQDGQVGCGPVFTTNHEAERQTHLYEIVAPANGAINIALRFLGVALREGCIDEFDVVGLGRHRFTEDW